MPASGRTWLPSLFLPLLVVVAGCAPADPGTTDPSRGGTSDRSAAATGGDPTPDPSPSGADDLPPVEDTTASLTPRRDDSDDPGFVEVAGPTLDDLYPAAPLHLVTPHQDRCEPFAYQPRDPDRAVARVHLLDVVLSGQEPAGPAAFELRDVVAKSCSDPTGALRSLGPCRDVVLPAVADPAQPQACLLGLRLVTPTDHHAQITFRLEATCTDAIRHPCDDPATARRAPTEQDPVTVRWSFSREVWG